MNGRVVEELARIVGVLCSEDCAGREPGSPEGLRARRFIADELRAAGLEPIEQPVPGSRGANLVARVHPGERGAVLVGAHFDHLGREMPGQAYWGADDNAAGVALVLALAHRLAERADALAGEVVLAFFDAEEPPQFMTPEMGSMHFVDHPIVPLDRIRTAVILDLVGHDLGPESAPPEVRRSVFALGAEKSPPLGDLVASAAAPVDGLWVRPLDIDVVPPLSDYEPFRRRGVPFLFLSCGRWRHYHEITDTPDRLAYEKIERILLLVDGLVAALLSHDGPPPRFDASLRGDADTLASLLALGRALAPAIPRAAAASAVLESVEERRRRVGSLSKPDWAVVQQVIALMESELE